MTQGEALTEARKRWGPGGYVDVEVVVGPSDDLPDAVVYVVGDSRDVYQAANEWQAEIDGVEEFPMGRGLSWEEAFADADEGRS